MRAPKKGSLLREVPIIVVSALVVSVVIKTFFLHFFFIPSGSMENTLQVGDRIAVNKLATFWSDIRRGEAVVFRDPANWLGAPYDPPMNPALKTIKKSLETVGILPNPSTQYLIKRVVGVGGDHVRKRQRSRIRQRDVAGAGGHAGGAQRGGEKFVHGPSPKYEPAS